jgi:AbrB family looped-hinge helix DNA binding protein
MFTLTMSTKGQFTLPKELRETLRLHAGCKVEGTVDDKGRLILVPALLEPEELFKNRPKVRRALSVEEMNEAIGKAAARGRP